MYYPNTIEELCYDHDHINMVVGEMRPNILSYFQKYVETEGGHSPQHDDLRLLAEKFGSHLSDKKKPKNQKQVLERLLKDAVNGFNEDREAYQEHLGLDALEEYGSDVNSFKNTILKNKIPIIRRTLQNKQAKELDKFRTAFNSAYPGALFTVTHNIISWAVDWYESRYNSQTFETISRLQDLGCGQLDEEGYTAFGVIGGGIKSHFIYKLFPSVYPNRSREAIWALYYLSDKKTLDCQEDSPFLMINKQEGITQQNYFYPYELFAFYALNIYRELKKLYAQENIILSEEHRFIVVDHFLSFVARSHQREIDLLKQSENNYQYDY